MNMLKKIRFTLFSTVFFLMFCQIHLAAQEQNENVYDITFRKLTSISQAQRNEALIYIKANKPVQLIPRIASGIVKDSDEENRRIYIKTLKLFSRDNTILYWLDILKDTGSFPLKIEIIEYLGSVNDRRIVLPVARQLDSHFSAVRRAAAKVLLKTGDDRIYPVILQMAGDKNPVRRIYALEAMQVLYDMRFYNMITELTDDQVKSVRIYAMKCIEKNNLKKAAYLLRKAALKDMDREVRITAIRILGNMRDASSSFVMTRSLSDSDRGVREAAVKAIYNLRYGGAAFSLSAQLMKESDNEIKYLILETMLRIRKTGNINAVKNILASDHNFRLRVLSAHVLGKISKDYHMTLLLQYANDRDYRVRAEIANSLGNYRSRKSIDGLFKMVNSDSSRYVRSSALYALFRINDRNTILPLFDRFSIESDYIFREQLRVILRKMISRRI